jgi:predicted amidophosphoribosyltransferase
MNKNVERNRRWQLKKNAAGLCAICGKPAVPGKTRCEICAEKNRRYQAKYRAS